MKISDIPSINSVHEKSMRFGDDNISYTQTGEYVVPKRVMEKFPAMAMGIMQATADVGLDPNQYLVGSPEGNYNPQTGAQEFFDINYYIEKMKESLTDIGQNAQKKLAEGFDDFVQDPLGNRVTQSALAGLGAGGIAKLAGASTDQAIQTAIGGALGYGALPKAKDGESPVTATDRLFAGLAGAYTAYEGYVPPPPPPPPTPSAPVMTDYASILATQPVDFVEDNEQANVSVGLPSKTPPAPAFTDMPEGVNYKKKVKDRKTGGFSYQEATPTSSFSRNINTEGRRTGLSPGFGSKVLYIDDDK